MECSWSIVGYSPARPNITASQLANKNIAGDFALSNLTFLYLGRVVYMFVNFPSRSKQQYNFLLNYEMQLAYLKQFGS